MITEQAFETLRAFAEEALTTGRGPGRERVELRLALDELRTAYEQARQMAVMVEPNGPADNVRQLRADRKLVEDAIARHVQEGMRCLTPQTRPTDGELWPTASYACAQWSLTRAQLLTLMPVVTAATLLREETLAALDSNPKEQQ